eukprot:5716425-Prymnesium_polylepis.1
MPASFSIGSGRRCLGEVRPASAKWHACLAYLQPVKLDAGMQPGRPRSTELERECRVQSSIVSACEQLQARLVVVVRPHGDHVFCTSGGCACGDARVLLPSPPPLRVLEVMRKSSAFAQNVTLRPCSSSGLSTDRVVKVKPCCAAAMTGVTLSSQYHGNHERYSQGLMRRK